MFVPFIIDLFVVKTEACSKQTHNCTFFDLCSQRRTFILGVFSFCYDSSTLVSGSAKPFSD